LWQVLDTPVSVKEEKMLMGRFSFMEKIGLKVLNTASVEHDEDHQRALLKRSQERSLHLITDSQGERLSKLHRQNVAVCFTIGIISAVICAVVENLLAFSLSTDGMQNLDGCCDLRASCNLCDITLDNTDLMQTYANHAGCEGGYYPTDEAIEGGNATICPLVSVSGPDGNTTLVNTCALPDEDPNPLIGSGCPVSPLDDVLTFWGTLLAVLGVCVAFEIGGMYYFSIMNACRVANALDMKLKPMNKDRAFVAGSLVRAALELGNSTGITMGVDPLKEASAKNACLDVVIALIYAGKIALSGFIIKVMIKRVASRGAAKYAMPWAAVPATAVWNGFVAHVIMQEAQLRGLGIATGIEIFNDITVSEEEISKLGKLQIVRAIGTNIMRSKDMYPTKEILLKHSVGAMALLKTKVVREGESGIVDDVEEFLEQTAILAKNNKKEAEMVLRVLVLVSVLDGRAKKKEQRMLTEIAAIIDPEKTVNVKMLSYIAARMRGHIPLTMDDIDDVFKGDDSILKIPGSFVFTECKAKCARFFAC
jgi:hypothetical protein